MRWVFPPRTWAAAVPGARAAKNFDQLTQWLYDLARPGDLILTVGAGDIYTVGENWSAGGKWNPPKMQSLRREPSLRDVVSHFGMSWDARGLETIQNGKNDDT